LNKFKLTVKARLFELVDQRLEDLWMKHVVVGIR